MTTSSPTEWCHANLVSPWRVVVSRDARRQSGGPLGRVWASKAAVRVEAVVKGLTVDAEDVGLQVPLLGSAVRAVSALERLPTWTKKKERKRKNRKQMEKTELMQCNFNSSGSEITQTWLPDVLISIGIYFYWTVCKVTTFYSLCFLPALKQIIANKSLLL